MGASRTTPPKSSAQPAGAHVALLRGINVGGRKLLPMKDLARLFEGTGCRDVSTYIQSGNVIFRAGAPLLAKLPATLERAIADRFGLRVPVVIRSAAELQRLARDNPFLTAGAKIESL